MKLKAHSLWLLRYTKERMDFTGGGGYCSHLPLPPNAPLGLSMATMRGLEKRGLVEEFISGCFRPTPLGISYLESEHEEQ